MAKVNLRCVDHPRDVECYQHGKFAVHLSNFEELSTGSKDSCYTITHITTGRMAATKCGRAEARRLAKALDAALEQDFTEDDVTSKANTWQAFLPTAKTLIEKAGAIR